ncbi:MAG: hypothetical protein C5B49_00565 [Bdellovibrio sp.]|nr:MAG: hypothetical protein C5B49_00565 [Bdellovibrio sp.]
MTGRVCGGADGTDLGPEGLKRVAMKRVIVMSGTLFLLSCAFSPADPSNDPNQKMREDRNQKLLARWESIKGIYEGTLVEYLSPGESTPTTKTSLIRIRLSYTFSSSGAKDQNGNLIIEPVPQGRLIQPESTELDAVMDADYNDQSGRLILVTKSAAASGASVKNSPTSTNPSPGSPETMMYGPDVRIMATLQNTVIDGELLTKDGGVIGQIHLALKSKEIPAAKREEQEQYDRLKANLQIYAGHYLMHIVPPPEAKLPPFDEDFEIFMDDIQINGTLRPYLVATGHRRTDMTPAGSFSIMLRDDVVPVELYIIPTATAGFNFFRGIGLKTVVEPRSRQMVSFSGRLQYATFAATMEARRAEAHWVKSLAGETDQGLPLDPQQ